MPIKDGIKKPKLFTSLLLSISDRFTQPFMSSTVRRRSGKLFTSVPLGTAATCTMLLKIICLSIYD